MVAREAARLKSESFTAMYAMLVPPTALPVVFVVMREYQMVASVPSAEMT